MPIDLLGGFFPPPVRPDPDRPHRVDSVDRDGRSSRDADSKRKRRSPPEQAFPDGDEDKETGRRISVQA